MSRPRAGLCVLAVLAGALVGCGHPPPPAPPGPDTALSDPIPRPRPDTVGPARHPAAPAPPLDASADAVATAGLRVMYTFWTDSDTGPATATRRALAYLTAPMSTDVPAAPPVASPGAQWADWAAHHAVLTPTVVPGADDTPPAPPATAYRQFVITQAVRGAGGWVGPDQQSIVFVTLRRTPAGWRIARVSRA